MFASIPLVDPHALDAFDCVAMNPHLAVLGDSGAGKTRFVLSRMERDLANGVGYLVLDSDGEYAEFARYVLSTVVVPGESVVGLDPFRLGEFGRYTLPTALADMADLLFAAAGPALAGVVRGDVYRLLGEYAWSTESVGALEGQAGPVAVHLRSWLDGSGDVVHDVLRRALDDVLGGPLGSHFGVLDGTDALDPKGLTVVSLRHIPSDYVGLVATCWALRAWRMALGGNDPYVLVLDDLAWPIVESRFLVGILLGIVRRARQCRLGVVLVTQDTFDVLESRLSSPDGELRPGLALLRDMAGKMLFCQAFGAQQVADCLSLGEGAGSYLSGLGVGEGLYLDARFQSGDGMGGVRRFRLTALDGVGVRSSGSLAERVK